ncbi:MAG TPA: hypothetical protein VKE41_08995 [Roseiflexaceae bacterium]|nr:hypothetical protein [Roseiflexaceae bacterium]
MRNSLIESLVLGCGIVLGVLLVQALAEGAPAMTQLLALLGVGVVLFCIQLVLTLRRRRSNDVPPEHEAGQQPVALLRRGRRNPFFRELTHDWTGLDDHPAEREAASPHALDELDDELWGDQPPATSRKTGSRAQRPDVNE